MSAYLVNDDTLDLLVSIPSLELGNQLEMYVSDNTLPPRSDLNYSWQFGPNNWHKYGTGSFNEIKRELALENLASVNARYGDGESRLAIKPFRPVYLIEDIDKAVMLGAIACYRYQACESDTWEQSYAFRIVESLEQIVIRKIRGNNWEFTRPANEPKVISLMEMLNRE